MAAKTVACLITLTTLMTLWALGSTAEIGNSYNQYPKSFNTGFTVGAKTICIINSGLEFDVCNKRITEFIGKNQLQENQIKDYCCAYAAFRGCIEEVANKRCGDQAEQTIEVYMSTVRNNVNTNSDCSNYHNIYDCMDQVVFFAVAFILALVAIGIFIGLICVCKSCCC